MSDKLPFALTSSRTGSGAGGIALSALNSTARRAGLTPGMRITDARAISPNLITRPDEPEKDRDALLRLTHWSTRWGPYVNLDGEDGQEAEGRRPDIRRPDGLWIDVTGVAHLFGGERALLHDIETRLNGLGLTPRLGLADTYGAAWAIARYAPAKDLYSRIARPGQTKVALARLPLSALRLNSNIIQLLKRLGLYHIKDIYDLPRASLKTRFSSRARAEAVLMRLDQALGEMKEPRIPLIEPALHETRRPYPDPLISGEGVEGAIKELAFELATELKALSLGARTLRLTIYRIDASALKVEINLNAPNNNPDHIIRLFHEKISRYDAGFGIDLITLGAFDCAELNHCQTGFDARHQEAKSHSLKHLIDRFENRLGPGTTYRLKPEESHIPERAQSRMNAARHSPSNNHTSDQPASWPDHTPPRPPLLLETPEPITVMAEIPEGPPAQFTWRRCIHRITRAEGPERIAPEWWREIGAAETCIRDYYRVEDLEGQRYWLFRDGLYNEDQKNGESSKSPEPLWYMHGLFG